MSFAAGDKIGAYEILAQIGKGGMGEVYRARDPRLGRDVAIKVSAEKFSERFEREARAIAALNHPNICTLYDVGPDYLVMEYVEGAPPKGPLPLADALRIAEQIASALEAAHDKNITHRDLKPGNIIVRPDGMVKVLDFGLAKIHHAEAGPGEAAETVTIGATQAGAILGTPAYMSPEQAKGLNVDKRADIWAFGVVLYEMLSGDRLFQGPTLTDILAAVVRQEPDWTKVPFAARRLLEKCLEKDPKKRLRDAGDAMSLVESGHAANLPSVTPAPSRSWLSMGGWAAAVLLLGLVAFLYFRGSPALPADPVRLQVSVPADINTAGRNFALSPDGHKLAFSAIGAAGVARIYVREMESLDVRMLPGTETPVNSPPMFWSPDSRFIAFSALGGQLKKVDLVGSPPQTICDAPGALAVSGTWNTDGVILFGSTGAGLWRVSASGGTAEPATTLDVSRKENRHAFPTFLPDRRHFIYLRSSSIPENNGVFIGSVDAKPDSQDLRLVAATNFGPVYVKSLRSGLSYLMVLRDGTLLSQVMSDNGTLSGEPTSVAQQVGANIAAPFFSASADGKLIYRTAGAFNNSMLYWFRRTGTVDSLPEQPRDLRDVALAPDGSRAVVVRQDSASLNRDLWMLDFGRSSSTRFTVDPRQAEGPVWFPDGSRILFQSNRDGPRSLYQRPSDGSLKEEVVLKAGRDLVPTSISSDGRQLLYTQADPKTKNDIWLLTNPGPGQGERKSELFLNADFNESEGRIIPGPSPRWVAYTSDESGKPEVYVREFKPGGARWVVSSAGGSNPRWRADSKELFFAAPDGTVMAAEISSGGSFQSGAPKALFKVSSGVLPNWEVASDGQRFLMLVLVEQNTQAPFTVLLNWESVLKRAP